MSKEILRTALALRERGALLVREFEDIILRIERDLEAGYTDNAREQARQVARGIRQRRKNAA